jgi:hypothetical protein
MLKKYMKEKIKKKKYKLLNQKNMRNSVEGFRDNRKWMI